MWSICLWPWETAKAASLLKLWGKREGSQVGLVLAQMLAQSLASCVVSVRLSVLFYEGV